MNTNRIMTTKELAEYIKLNEKTVLKMAQEGTIPGVKIGSQWRFHLDRVDAYLQNDIIKSNESDLNLIIGTGVNILPLSRLITEDLIDINLKGSTVDDVLAELTAIVTNAHLTSSGQQLISELKKREKMLSTAIGNNVALPHPRHPKAAYFKKPNIVIARSLRGVNFNAPDKKPVHLFFMTCAPNEFVHLRLLAKISKLLHESGRIEKFIQSDSKEEIVKILLEFDRQHFFPLGKG
jgi:PTS system nitrogen regulatory IIA component